MFLLGESALELATNQNQQDLILETVSIREMKFLSSIKIRLVLIEKVNVSL